MLKNIVINIYILFLFFSYDYVLAKDLNQNVVENIKVMYFTEDSEQNNLAKHIKYAAATLGINILLINNTLPPSTKDIENTSAVIISSDYFENNFTYINNILKEFQSDIPFLFNDINISSQKSFNLIGIPAEISETTTKRGQIVVASIPITSYFGGLSLECKIIKSELLTIPGSQKIISFKGSHEGGPFIRSKLPDNRKIYLLSNFNTFGMPNEYENLFVKIIPYLIFFSDVGNDLIWRGSDYFANLTIDDPFLIEPYGSLYYEKLIHEMDLNNFHTTIAFIPRNFDRNEEQVANLFKRRPDRFSIAIHGNNHDRMEFNRYTKKSWFELIATKSLKKHEFNIAQSLVRMNEFALSTGIKYDSVMVFPQAISPAPTLELLKKYGFLATINGSNLPLDSSDTEETKYNLRPVITSFYGFPSFRRFRVKYSNSLRIRLELFLGNPIFIYSHHDLFESNIKEFNLIAKEINRLNPKLKWKSLGEIFSNWYLIRRNLQNTYDVKIFTPLTIISNNHDSEEQYFICKENEIENRIQTILVDGNPIKWHKSGKKVCFSTKIAPKNFAKIQFEYGYKNKLANIGAKDNDSLRIIFWRGLSEFRDRYLGKTILGRTLRDLIYNSGVNRFAVIVISFFSILILTFIIYLLYYKLRKSKKCGLPPN